PSSGSANIDDIGTFGACLNAAKAGCGLDQNDLAKDICLNPDFVPCLQTFNGTYDKCRPPLGTDPYFVNGFDLTRATLAYDPKAGDLWLGWRSAGQIGDSDGDGTTSVGSVCANAG